MYKKLRLPQTYFVGEALRAEFQAVYIQVGEFVSAAVRGYELRSDEGEFLQREGHKLKTFPSKDTNCKMSSINEHY